MLPQLLLVVFLVAAAAIPAPAPPSPAASFRLLGIELEAEDPVRKVAPGDRVRFPLTLRAHTDEPVVVRLDLQHAPGVDPRISHERVRVSASDPVELEVWFRVPENAFPGQRLDVVVAARADELRLALAQEHLEAHVQGHQASTVEAASSAARIAAALS